jgi:hypothetical protein
MTDKISNYAPNVFVKVLEITGLVNIHVGCHLSQCDRYDVVKVGS